MRCHYIKKVCALPGDFVCHQCAYCGRHFSIAAAVREQIDEQLAKLPDCPRAAIAQAAGVGIQLVKLLARLGIRSPENCSCGARVDIMNTNGVEWCTQHIGEIVGWLKEEAERRGLPFLAFPAKILVERAIKIAKRRLAKRA